MQPPTILVVDDDPWGQRALDSLLRSLGYRLLFASDGPSALAMAEAERPDLILLDVILPLMDGFTVCRHIRANPAIAELPIVLVTALDDREARLDGLAAGADDFIAKPFDRAELRARVQSITRLNRYRALHSARERFAWVLDHASEGYVIVGPDCSMRYANPQAQQFLGLHGTEWLNHDFLAVATAHYRCVPTEAWQAWANGSASPTTLYLVQAGTYAADARWLRIQTTQMPDGEGMLQLRNVTSEVNLKRDVWSFHGAVSHKLRTPLVGFSAMDMLCAEPERFSAHEIREFAQITTHSMHRLRDEIEDLLTYAHLKVLPQPSAQIDLRQFQTMLLGMQSEVGIAQLQFQTDLPLDTKLLLGDKAIETVMWEILENSRKFHPQSRPQVAVTVRSQGETEILISVSDDGISLHPIQATQVWAPYYQAEPQFTGEVAGMGLGLSLVATIMWSAGGTYRIANRANGPGVVVELLLPRESEPRGEP